jgi:hypothetical protein
VTMMKVSGRTGRISRSSPCLKLVDGGDDNDEGEGDDKEGEEEGGGLGEQQQQPRHGQVHYPGHCPYFSSLETVSQRIFSESAQVNKKKVSLVFWNSMAYGQGTKYVIAASEICGALSCP